MSYAAFISYAHRHQGWVKVLHRNLEQCLGKKIFLDTVDLGSGQSWVLQLQAGLFQAERLLLVVTPEALASMRVADEWQAFLAEREGWKGTLHLAILVETPLPPFLKDIHTVDFCRHDAAKYRQGVRELYGGLLGLQTRRNLPTLPAGLEVPNSPDLTLDPAIRFRLIEHLAPLLKTRMARSAVESALGFGRGSLGGQPSAPCGASALLVWAIADDEPKAAVRRILAVLCEECGEDYPAAVAGLQRLALEPEVSGKDAVGGLLELWLNSVYDDHKNLLPFFESSGPLPLLDKVYVQLELRSQNREWRLLMGHSPVDQPLEIQQLLSLSTSEHPWVTHRWVLLGDPGAGKTTLLRHLCWTLAASPQRRWLPVFESLSRLMEQHEDPLESIEKQLRRADQRVAGLATLLRQRAEQGDVLFLLDGLDEVPSEKRGEAERLLRRLAQAWPQAPMVVTSRPIGYQRPDNSFREVEVLPLDGERRKTFLARWFGRDGGELDVQRAEEAFRRLQAEPSLRELAGNPLYLTLMALLLEDRHTLQTNRARLYDQVFDLLMEGRHRPVQEPMPCQQGVRRALRHLAHGMTHDNHDAEPVIALETRLLQVEADELRKLLERVPRWRQGLRPFLDDVSVRTGILGPHDGRYDDWRFWHRTFREALAAEELEQRFLYGGSESILEHAREIAGDESRWAEPYALLAGRIDQPDELVRALVQENRALGLRAVATAQGLAVETLRSVLDLSDKWEERRKVYERIPELLDDAQRSLALLDQLRQSTRNGNDLFFLDEAVAAVGEKWPQWRPAAEELRGRLYDHIPIPPEDLFQAVETPHAGRVALWQKISPGTFIMGSPEGEEGRFDYLDHPPHKVTLTSSFWFGVVPITNRQYQTFDDAFEPRSWSGVEREDLAFHPAVDVTWFEAMSFCRWLSSRAPWASGARLPFEEEWEYACRAGTRSRFWSGDQESDLARVGWYEENSTGRTHRVGEKPPNPWGLFDVHGNVVEWTHSVGDSGEDRQADIEMDSSCRVPADLAAAAADRVVRGGSYGGQAQFARSAYRGWVVPGFSFRFLGFRVLLPSSPRF